MNWEEVPGWFDFHDIYQEAVDAAPVRGAHLVELGTFFGRSALFMADAIKRSGKNIRFDTIDICHARSNYIPRNPTAPWVEETARKHGNVRLAFEHHLRETGLGQWLNVIQMDLLRAAEHYAPRSLDFVFADADHSYEATRDAIRAWLPKVRIGGVFAGHDYIPKYPGVEQAVREVLGDEGYVVRRTSFWTRVI